MKSILLILAALTIGANVIGCTENSDTSGYADDTPTLTAETDGETDGGEETVYEYEDDTPVLPADNADMTDSASADTDESAWSENHETAPMPENEVTAEDLLGKWSPDADAAEPSFIEFYEEDGQLRYRYYRVLLGNGSGIGLATGTTEFEYNLGAVHLQGNQGSCNCLVGDTAKVYISFYCMDPTGQTITDQEDGTVFYKC